MRILTNTMVAVGLALTLLPKPATAQDRDARRSQPAPNAVVLSNGQRWERISLQHIDARVLAPLFGAIVLPTADPAWNTGPAVDSAGFLSVWSPVIATLLPLLQQGGGGVPFGGGTTAPGATGPANPAGLPVLVDPVTN